MRGSPDPQLAMLTTLSTEDRIPPGHPIRRIRAVVDVVLVELDDVFDGMYAVGGRGCPGARHGSCAHIIEHTFERQALRQGSSRLIGRCATARPRTGRRRVALTVAPRCDRLAAMAVSQVASLP